MQNRTIYAREIKIAYIYIYVKERTLYNIVSVIHHIDARTATQLLPLDICIIATYLFIKNQFYKSLIRDNYESIAQVNISYHPQVYHPVD